ncbi:hypothetical protein BB558_000358 [Smittium angustum]|uniref:PB1 domain-containing protein n=1 Tax=Smittium angustum TaxID=133377 RepID=A0A2U1JEM2_SMIAN|nr:hypothetical protein BB558_000358 [Smittium angustum]
MSLKAEIEQWTIAVNHYDNGELDQALSIFMKIADSAKVHFNIGLILSQKGEHEKAIQAYKTALSLDQYLSVAYFQKGVANMIIQNNSEALNDFVDSFLYLRGNDYIDYSQIGLNYKIFACEVLYNRALCQFCLGDIKDAQKDLKSALSLKSKDRHNWIDKALASNGVDCPLFCIPKGIIYRPSNSKIQSTKKIDYLGNARLIATTDTNDSSTGFKGAIERKNLQAGQSNSNIFRSVSVRDKKPIDKHEHSNTGNLEMGQSNANTKDDVNIQRSQSQRRFKEMAAMHQRELPNKSPLSQKEKIDHDNAAEVKKTDFPNINDQSETAPSGVENTDTHSGSENGGSHVDPIDIIRAGLARRVTLNKKNQAQTKTVQEQGTLQRSASTKQIVANPNQSVAITDQKQLHHSPSVSALVERQFQNQSPKNLHSNGSSQRQRQNTENAGITEADQSPMQRNKGNFTMNGLVQGHSHSPSLDKIASTPNSQNAGYSEQYKLKPSQNFPINQSPSPHQLTNLQRNIYSPDSASASMTNPIALSVSGDDQTSSSRTPTIRGRMKVKLHFESEIYNVMVPERIDFYTLHRQINNKVAKATGRLPVCAASPNEQGRNRQYDGGVVDQPQIKIRYLDEDNEMVLMVDSDDFELAKGYAGGDMSSSETNVISRIELWCSI